MRTAKFAFEALVEERGYVLLGEYVNNRTKVLLRCPNLHEYSQTPHNFSVGAGCLVCQGRSIKSLETRLRQCREVHGRKYDYSTWVEGVTAFSRVSVTCIACDESWETTVDNHVRGRGCPNCKSRVRELNKIHSTALGINRKWDLCLGYLTAASEHHHDYYDYSKITLPFNVKSAQPIICPEHGVFQQVMYSHAVKGYGCPKCTDPRVSEKAKDKIREQHRYSVDKWREVLKVLHPTLGIKFHEDYQNAKSKVTAICPDHGEWVTSIDSLNQGAGCPACKGHSQKYLYINQVSDGSIKYGIAKDPQSRLSKQNRVNSFEMQTLLLFKFNEYGDCRLAESSIKQKVNPVVSKLDMPDGWTETASISEIETIVNVIKSHGGVQIDF